MSAIYGAFVGAFGRGGRAATGAALQNSRSGFGSLPFARLNLWHWLVSHRALDIVKSIIALLSTKLGAFIMGIAGRIIVERLQHWWELRKWRRQIFLDRVQCVLFSADFPAGRVEKRTMFEVDLPSVLGGNHAAAKEVRNAAALCTPEKPFLTQHLAAWERYHVLNAVLNTVSCQYSSGHLIADLGGSFVSDWYAFAITAEEVTENPVGMY